MKIPGTISRDTQHPGTISRIQNADTHREHTIGNGTDKRASSDGGAILINDPIVPYRPAADPKTVTAAGEKAYTVGRSL